MQKLSIITVNYNNLSGLKKTFESIQSQTFHDYEWIVIDGGSTDGSREFLIQNKNHLAYWISEQDEGIYNAMNKGIAKAKGDYSQFLNSGDYYINKDVLQRVFAIQKLSDVNYGDQWCINEAGEVLERRSYPDHMSLPFLFRSPLGHQASFIKTEVVKRHPYKEQYSISADRALFLELYCAGCSFYHISLPVVYFDTEGIGSNKKTYQERKKQFYLIKREYFSDQVVKDIEMLLRIKDNFAFVERIKPLKGFYNLMRKLQSLKNKK